MAIIRPLAEADLPAAQRIVRTAFGTFFGVPDLETFWTDFDYVYGRHGCGEHRVFRGRGEWGAGRFEFRDTLGQLRVFRPAVDPPRSLGRRFRATAGRCGMRRVRTLAGQPFRPFHLRAERQARASLRQVRLLPALPDRDHGGAGKVRNSMPEVLVATRPWCRGRADDAPPRMRGVRVAPTSLTTASTCAAKPAPSPPRKASATRCFCGTAASRLGGMAVCHWGPASEAGAETLLCQIRRRRSRGQAQTGALRRCSTLAARSPHAVGNESGCWPG